MFEVDEVNNRTKKVQTAINPLEQSNAIHVDTPAGDTAAVRRIQGLTNQIGSHMPSSTDRPLLDRAAPIDAPALEAQNNRLEGLISDLAAAQTHSFPNLAWEAVKAGLAKEELTNRQLNDHIKQAEKHQKDIDLLLDFSAELTAYKEDTEMPESMKTKLNELKERGIDLWKSNETKLSKDKISQLKSLSSSQVDKSRSNLQIIFTTKIQSLVQSIGAIMETLKDIIRNNSKLISTANRLPGH